MSIAATRHLFEGGRKSPPMSQRLGDNSNADTTVPITSHDCFGESASVQHRIGFILRDGRYWSYPTAFIAMAYSPNPNELILSCRCGEIAQIVIAGQDLHPIAESLRAGRLAYVKEAESPFTQPNSPFVSKIIKHAVEY